MCIKDYISVHVGNELSHQNMFSGVYGQSKYFCFLASALNTDAKKPKYFLSKILHCRVLYLANEVYCKSLLCVQALYVYQRLYFCSCSKRQNGDY